MNMKNPLNLDIEKIVAYLLFDMKWNDVLKIHCLTNEYDMSNTDFDDYYKEGVELWLEAKHLIEKGIELYKGDEESYLFVESDNFILIFDFMEWGDVSLIYSPKEYRNHINIGDKDTNINNTDIDDAIHILRSSTSKLNLYKITNIFNEMGYKYGFSDEITPSRLMDTVCSITKSAMKCAFVSDSDGGYSSCGRFMVHYGKKEDDLYVCFTPIEAMSRMPMLDGKEFHPYDDIANGAPQATYKIADEITN